MQDESDGVDVLKGELTSSQRTSTSIAEGPIGTPGTLITSAGTSATPAATQTPDPASWTLFQDSVAAWSTPWRSDQGVINVEMTPKRVRKLEIDAHMPLQEPNNMLKRGLFGSKSPRAGRTTAHEEVPTSDWPRKPPSRTPSPPRTTQKSALRTH